MKKRNSALKRGPGTLLFYYGIYAFCNLVFLAVYGPHFGYAVLVRNNLNFPVAITPIDVDETGAFAGVTPSILHSFLFLHNRRSVNIVVPPFQDCELYFDAVEHGPDKILFRRLEENGDLHEKVVPLVKRLTRSQTIAIERSDSSVRAVGMMDVIAKHDSGPGGFGLIALLELMGLWVPVCLPAMIGFAIFCAFKAFFDKP